MTKLEQMQNLVSNIKVENIEVENVEDTKEREEFGSYLEQTIYEKCLEIGSKIDNAKTGKDEKAAVEEWTNLEHNCLSFMTRAEFKVIRDKAYNKLHPKEQEDIAVEDVKELIDKNTDLYWKIIHDNNLRIFGLMEEELTHNCGYYYLGGDLKRIAEEHSQRGLEQMYLNLKKDYEALVEIEKEYKIKNSKKQPYIEPTVTLFTDDSELISSQLYTCKLDLGDADEDISDWEESDKAYFELDKKHYEGLIEELENKYGNKLDHIEGYRYSVSNLNEDDIELLESLIQDTESNLDYCYVRYDFEEVEAA